MKNIKKLLLTVFIIALLTANLLAMEDGEMEIVQDPESAAAIAGTTSTTTEQSLLSIAENVDLVSLPDLALENVLTQYIESDLANASNQAQLLEELEIAINRLKNLRLINKRFASFLTYQTIISILINANIVMLANRIDLDSGETLLHRAIRTERILLSKILIDAGVDINIPLVKPRNPIMTKRFPIGTTPLHTATMLKCPNLVNLLIQHGADITARTISSIPNKNNRTALDYARAKNHATIIEMLETAYQTRGLAVPPIAVATYPNAIVLDFSNL